MSEIRASADDRYRLVFDGPENDAPETLRKIKGVFIADLDLSIEKVIEIFKNGSTPIMESDSEADLTAAYKALRLAGGRVAIVGPKKSAQGQASAAGIDLDCLVDAYEDIFDELDPEPIYVEPILSSAPSDLKGHGPKNNSIASDGSVAPCRIRLEEVERNEFGFDLSNIQENFIKSIAPVIKPDEAKMKARPAGEAKLPSGFYSLKILAELDMEAGLDEPPAGPRHEALRPKPGIRASHEVLLVGVVSLFLIFGARAGLGLSYRQDGLTEKSAAGQSSVQILSRLAAESRRDILYGRNIGIDQDSIVRLRFEDGEMSVASLRVAIAPPNAPTQNHGGNEPVLRQIEVNNLQALDLGGGRFEAKGAAFAAIEVKGELSKIQARAIIRGKFDLGSGVLEGEFEISRGDSMLPPLSKHLIQRAGASDFILFVRDSFSSPKSESN